jgi:hypothetical protein
MGTQYWPGQFRPPRAKQRIQGLGLNGTASIYPHVPVQVRQFTTPPISWYRQVLSQSASRCITHGKVSINLNPHPGGYALVQCSTVSTQSPPPTPHTRAPPPPPGTQSIYRRLTSAPSPRCLSNARFFQSKTFTKCLHPFPPTPTQRPNSGVPSRN